MNRCRPTKRAARQFIRLDRHRMPEKRRVGLRPECGRCSYKLFYAEESPEVPVRHKNNAQNHPSARHRPHARFVMRLRGVPPALGAGGAASISAISGAFPGPIRGARPTGHLDFGFGAPFAQNRFATRRGSELGEPAASAAGSPSSEAILLHVAAAKV